jgi:hypothetical protein
MGWKLEGHPGYLWISMDIQGISMDIPGYRWISRDIQGWSVRTAPERGVNTGATLERFEC